MGLDLKGTFEQARVHASGKELDELRQQYFIQATMRGSDDSSIGGIRVNTSGRKTAKTAAEKKEKQRMDDLILLAMLNDQLAAIEGQLADKYGEDFAEQLAADLLSEEDYEGLMKIEDKDERRRAIANAINDGINDGSIDERTIRDNPDFAAWLDTHRQKRQLELALDAADFEGQEHETATTAHDISGGSRESDAFDAVFGATN